MSRSAKYQRLSPISHIHKRTEMYAGPTKTQTERNVWVMDIKTLKFTQVPRIRYSPALERIFIEAISNAIDNNHRSKKSKTPCTKIKVSINQETGLTTVWNDGKCIPIEKKKEMDVYVPTMIFGQLLSGENYDDTKHRYTSGRNGIGIKLANTLSTEFQVRASDGIKNFTQTWTEHMRKASKPKVTTLRKKGKQGFTEVSWIPDFAIFHCKGYSKHILRVLYKHVYDCAMISGIPVYLNGKKIPVKSLKDYAKLYLKDATREIMTFQTKTCEVVLTPSEGNFEFIAFTNGIANKDGGVHVNAWREAIFRPLLNKINRPNKPHVNINDVTKYFRIFINSKVPNPEFSNQSKTKLTSPNVTVKVAKEQITKIYKWAFIQEINDLIKGKELVKLKKVSKKSRSFKKIQGFDPANNAGGKQSQECTLILCEGLSAKTYAVRGIQVGWGGKKGRDWFAIYPLRGKLLNVRNAKISSIAKNKEISDVINALGIEFGLDYRKEESFKRLNYGRIMIICDSDVDGIHISALIMNLFHKLFPTLLQRQAPFIISMQTPIVKVFMKKKELLFYTQAKFNEFARNTHRHYKTKYYKGLGTSSDKEVTQTFGKRVIKYIQDENTDENMDKVFSSKYSDRRKKWLETYDPKLIIPIKNEMTYSDFINHRLIEFSIDDCARSIPNLFDGLKQSLRKILFAVFKKNLNYKGPSMKVAQLAGYVAEQTNYHHGEQCLSCMTKMANDFPGSNNIPLLYPDGQFGSKLQGGKDAANARYIFTKMGKYTRYLFPEADDALLEKVEDDGDFVEPYYFVPILPLILANGCSAGIGTGWSCFMPQYNPIDLVNAIKSWLNNEELDELTPWYRGFKGEIKKISPTKYETSGLIEKERNKYIIRELPINMWTDKYKEFLEDLLENKKLKSMKNYSTPTSVHFEIIPHKEFKCTTTSLKLKTYLHISNMVLFTESGKLQKFTSISAIINIFCEKRLELYIKRKKAILKQLQYDLKYLNNEKRFLTEVMSDHLVLKKRPEKEIVQEMATREYDKKDGSFNYLLNMSMVRFTENKLTQLLKNIQKNDAQIHQLEQCDPKNIWLKELQEFVTIYK